MEINYRELLTKLRGRLAYSKQCAPYLIFADKELELLLNNKPKTLEELSNLKGFPKDGKRVSGWGNSIIDIFTKGASVKDFEVKLDATGEPQSLTVLRPMDVF